MSLRSKEKTRFFAFLHTVEIQVSPSNLKNLTASPGVERVRTPSGYFFGTFFVQAKKVHIVSHPHGSREGAHTLCVLFWAVRPPAILADKQEKITKLSFAKPCSFSRHKFKHENSDGKPKPHYSQN